MLDQEGRDKMKERLEGVHEWPSLYMFKFILEPDEGKIEQLAELFPEGAELLRRYSKGGKFVSLTVREVMMSADEVLDRYDRASKVQGVIML